MDFQRTFSTEVRFLKGEKVDVTSGRQQYWALFLLLLSIVLLTLSIYCNIKFYGVVGVMSCYLINIVALFSILLTFILSLRMVDLGLKNDTLFVHHYFSVARIMDLDEVKEIRSGNFLGLHFLFIRYNYGDKFRKAIVIQRNRASKMNCVYLLLNQIHLNKEKSKSKLIENIKSANL